MMKTVSVRKSTVLVLGAALFLSACGIKGELQTPPPLWGDKAPQVDTDKQKQESNDQPS